jgi:hypothetical protein
MRFDGIGANSVVFSPNSDRTAYAARLGSTWYAVVDERVLSSHPHIVFGSLAFTLDSQHLAYAARARSGHVVLLDDEVLLTCDCIITIGGGRIQMAQQNILRCLTLTAGAIYTVEVVL